MKLSLIDVSAVVHTGMKSEYYRERMFYGFPVGGIHFLTQQLCVHLMMRDEFVLCFDSPNFRTKEFPKYKSGRARDMAVILQLEALFEWLQACGIKCEKAEGYEADDIISWAATALKENYDEVIILGNDKDLCHSVRNNVRFKSIRSDLNSIYYGNFEDSIERGEKIMFNTISAYKVFCGCRSDAIPAFKTENGVGGRKLYSNFTKFCADNGVAGSYVKTSNPGLVEIYAKYSGLFTEADKKRLKKQIRLVYPAPMPRGFCFSPTGLVDVDLKKFSHFLTLFNAVDAFKNSMFVRQTLTDEDKQYVKELARQYSTGEAFADRNIEYSLNRLGTDDMRLDSFSRDF